MSTYVALDKRQRNNTTVDLMIFSYGIFAAMLVNQGLVGNELIRERDLNNAINDLNRANSEQDVLDCTLFNPDSIWYKLYINVETGALAIKQDGGFYDGNTIVSQESENDNYYSLMQYPNESHITQDVIKDPADRSAVQKIELTTFQSTSRGRISYIADPFDKTEKRDTPASFNTCFLCFWSYLHGSLSVEKRIRSILCMYTRNSVDRYISFLENRLENNGVCAFWRTYSVAGKKNELEPHALSIARATDETDIDNAKAIVENTILRLYFPQHEIYDSCIMHKSKKFFIVLFILFLIITVLSNIFAWANIIAIAATTTKIIISGVGSIIGVGCLSVAIALCCKDKVCDDCCKHQCKDSFNFEDDVKNDDAAQPLTLDY